MAAGWVNFSRLCSAARPCAICVRCNMEELVIKKQRPPLPSRTALVIVALIVALAPRGLAGLGHVQRAERARNEMPHLTTDDGVKLYYEETGSGIPIIFVHEFAGDHRAWEPQIRYFGAAIAASPTMRAAIRHPTCRKPSPIRKIARATTSAPFSTHSSSTRRILSGFRWAASQRSILALPIRSAPRRCASRLRLRRRSGQTRAIRKRGRGCGRHFEKAGMAEAAEAYALRADACAVSEQGPARLEGIQQSLKEHSTDGAARTMRGVQKSRPSFSTS